MNVVSFNSGVFILTSRRSEQQDSQTKQFEQRLNDNDAGSVFCIFSSMLFSVTSREI